ncbi:MAG: 4Fe-4S binding protein [Opitutales bacterium]|tara:strand:- start:54 stop:359 length:306 start_codon:yes stop_codon:yes gene_type:complete
MTYVVTEKCVDCKFTYCAAVCPVEAFHEGENILYINPDTCIDCNACVPECPVEAILADVDVPSELESWIEINAQEAEKHPVIIDTKEPLRGSKCVDPNADQ